MVCLTMTWTLYTFKRVKFCVEFQAIQRTSANKDSPVIVSLLYQPRRGHLMFSLVRHWFSIQVHFIEGSQSTHPPEETGSSLPGTQYHLALTPAAARA